MGGFIAGWFSRQVKRDEYANDYYKIVLSRRLAAYEEVEQLLIMLKATVADLGGQPYHILFSKDDDAEAVYKLLFAVMSNALWVTDDLYDLVRNLNLMVYNSGVGKAGLIEFGKKNYKAIAELRSQIEGAHSRDMLVLHDVPRFLKGKRSRNDYTSLDRRG